MEAATEAAYGCNLICGTSFHMTRN